jgi:hypothetical protein
MHLALGNAIRQLLLSNRFSYKHVSMETRVQQWGTVFYVWSMQKLHNEEQLRSWELLLSTMMMMRVVLLSQLVKICCGWGVGTVWNAEERYPLLEAVTARLMNVTEDAGICITVIFLSVIMSYMLKCPVNPITNLNPNYSHFVQVTTGVRSGTGFIDQLDYLNQLDWRKWWTFKF